MSGVVTLHGNLEGVNGLERVYLYVEHDQDWKLDSVLFKKNEKLSGMAKSMLKHRIQSLTGKSIATIEKEMTGGRRKNSLDGLGLDVAKLRKLAHFLILCANDDLPEMPKIERKLEQDDESRRPVSSGRETVKKTTRRSMMTPNHETTAVINATPRVTRRKTLGSEVLTKAKSPKKKFKPERELEETEPEETEENFELDNPTPAMIETARRRSATTTAKSKGKKKNNGISPIKKEVVPPKIGFSGIGGCQIYLAHGDSLNLAYKQFSSEVDGFSGADLTLIHCPDFWIVPEIYTAVSSVVKINEECGLKNFLILVKVEIDNVKSVKESLAARFTKHCQLVTFYEESAEVADPGSEDFLKLRETTTNYLVAYFFHGCEIEGSRLPERMVRDGTTTCIGGDNPEDLENKIVDAFSEKGDWIMELACATSEIVLAAQKMGRFALAFDEDEKVMEDLAEKAAKIAAFHDKTFKEIDGDVFELNA